MESKQGRLHRVGRLLIISTAAVLSLCALIDSSAGQEPPVTRPPAGTASTATHAAGDNAAVTRDLVDLLKTSAERSERAVQATADSVRAYTDLLRAEAERSERATTHEIDTIERTLAKLTSLVQLGAILLAGLGAVMGALLAYFGWGTVRDVRRQVKTGIETLQLGAQSAVDTEIKTLKSAAQSEIKGQVEALKRDSQSVFKQQVDGMRRQLVKESEVSRKEIEGLIDKIMSDARASNDQLNTTRDLLSSMDEDVTKLAADLVQRRASISTVVGQPEPLTEGQFSGKKSVIWVDDQPNTTLAARNELIKNGIKVEAVESTAELEELLAKSPNKFDLIVSDMRRGKNAREGLDYFQRIRGKNHPPGLIFAPKKLLRPVESEIEELRAADSRFLGAVSGSEPFFTKVFQVLRST
jgi:CheY-like chemotaxis protein